MEWNSNFDRLMVGGRWIEPASSERITVVSPITEEVVGSVAAASRADVDAAVGVARAAFDNGPWPRRDIGARSAVLQRVRDALSNARNEFADLVTSEMGCPITQSRAIQAGIPVALLDAYLDVAAQFSFSEVRQSESGSALVTRVPVGVVAAVVPWNVPLAIAVHKLAPALLAGCSVVLKPAPETPLSALRLAELFEQAGLDDGVLSVLPAGREVSEYLVTHPGVDKVTFTGSTVVGRRIGALCGQGLKRVSLELGGKSAAVVLDDADLDSAVESLRLGSLRNSGQVCSLKTRIIVPEQREVEFVERLCGLLRSMPVGDPRDPETQIGPMVTARQRDNVERYVAIGKAEGATAVIGGGTAARDRQGWFVEPTIFTGVCPSMQIAQEEIFGPVLAVLTYRDEDAAVELANDSQYGLNGAVFSADPERALRFARRIRTGTVEINGRSSGLFSPIGGFKSSGIGREQGPEGFEAYTECKAYGIDARLARRLMPSES